MDIFYEFTLFCLKFFYSNYSLATALLLVGIVGAVFGLVQLVKKPIKKLTAKITNEKLRKLANKSLIFLSFGFSVGLWFLLNVILPSVVQIDWALVLLTGALPVVAHAVYDGLIGSKTAKQAVEAIKDITEDGKIDKNDTTAIKDFFDKNESPAVKEFLETIKKL